MRKSGSGNTYRELRIVEESPIYTGDAQEMQINHWYLEEIMRQVKRDCTPPLNIQPSSARLRSSPIISYHPPCLSRTCYQRATFPQVYSKHRPPAPPSSRRQQPRAGYAHLRAR